jgi:RimJ/RimL family protein N-acetyltransferase
VFLPESRVPDVRNPGRTITRTPNVTNTPAADAPYRHFRVRGGDLNRQSVVLSVHSRDENVDLGTTNSELGQPTPDQRCVERVAVMEYPDVHPVTLVGDRVTLREVDPIADAAAAFAWASDAAFFRYMPYEPVESEAEEEEFLRHVHGEALVRPRREYHLGIEWTGARELIGMVRLTVSSPSHRGGDIGFGVRPNHWGQGIATAASRLLVTFGFDDLGLHRVWAVHHPDNGASARVLQKLGMRREGRLREDMFAHGVWRDSIVYGVLEGEWRAQGD